MDGNVAAKLAERFKQSFTAVKTSHNVERVKREAAEPLDHVVAIMEDIKKEMHSLEVNLWIVNVTFVILHIVRFKT